MALKNKAGRYGSVARFFHWSMFLLFVYQFVGANVMTRLGRGESVFGMDGNAWYSGHKSIGLVVLGLVVGRLIWRKTTPLLRWHDSLTPVERTLSSRLEISLYTLMFLLPVTGYVFVMAGGFGINFFGVIKLPDPIGKQALLASFAQAAHVTLGYALIIAIAWHVGLVLKKHVLERTGLLDRMRPFGC